jgi:hypothetical protein
MRSVTAVVAAALVPLVAGGCGTGPGGTRHVSPAPCPASALVLRHGAAVVPMTGEHAVMYALTNRSLATCTVRGYPQAVLYDANGGVLPFRYAAGGGPYVTSRKPSTIVLAHGASAYVLLAKYRCDLGIASNVTAIRLTLRNARGGIFTQQEAAQISGAAGLSYCRGGPDDPGQLITISPLEPTEQATSSLP